MRTSALLGDGKMHARARAGMGQRVVDADPAGGGCGASDGYAQGYPKSGVLPSFLGTSLHDTNVGTPKDRRIHLERSLPPGHWTCHVPQRVVL